MSIQMDTWIDSSNVEQWKKGCKRKMSKSNQALQGMATSATLSTPSVAASGATTVWANGPQHPPQIKLFSYYRTEHRYSTYRQIRILSWHISVEHTNRNLCKYKETSSPAEAKSGNLNDERCRNK